MLIKHSKLLALHGAIILFALCALFAKWLSLPATVIVFGRTVFAVIAILIFCLLISHSLRVAKPLLVKLLFNGALLAFHWWSFFYSIQLSTVTLGLLAFATYPIWVVIINAVVNRTWLNRTTLMQLTLCTIGVVVFLSPDVSNVNLNAFFIGTLSALSFALLTLYNKKQLSYTPALTIAFYQNFFASILLLPFVIGLAIMPNTEQLITLALLGIVFTALAHILLLHSLKTISAVVVSMSLLLEPVYGVFAATVLLNEVMTTISYSGALLVILACVWASKKQT